MASSRRLRKSAASPADPLRSCESLTETVTPTSQPLTASTTHTSSHRAKQKDAAASDKLLISPVSDRALSSTSRADVFSRLGARAPDARAGRSRVLDRLGARAPPARSPPEPETDTSRASVLERLGPRPPAGGESAAAAVRVCVPEHLCHPKIVNVCGGTSLGVRLDLKSIALRARNTAYNPRRFNALFMRLRTPAVTASLFSTGKLNVSGARSEGEATLAIRKLAKKVRKMGHPEARMAPVVIYCMMAMFTVPFQIRLERVAAAHCPFCSYEPELFPALVYKMMAPKVTLLIYVNGKVNIMGVKRRQDAVEAFRKIFPVLKNCEKIDGSW